MPNWCSNTTYFYHDSASRLVRLYEAIQDRKLLEHLQPLPNNEWNYEWCVKHWGTKWEVDITDVQEHIAEGYIEVSFESAWGPPIETYYYAERELDFRISSYFHESGTGIIGEFSEGQDYYWDYPTTRNQARRLMQKLPGAAVNKLDLKTEWEEYFDED